jgi:hypothetical protein
MLDINAGSKVRYTVCFGNLQQPAKLYGRVVTTYGRARADVLFDDAPGLTTVLIGDLVNINTERSAEVVPLDARRPTGCRLVPEAMS